MDLHTASNEWSTRPADQRFWTLDEMYQASKTYADGSAVANVGIGDLSAVVRDNTPLIASRKTGQEAKLTHYAFGQLARVAGAPAEYLRSLPAPLAADCINTGLRKRDDADSVKLLLHRNGSLLTRAITSQSYDRVWNHEVIAAIARNLDGWQVPPARPAGIAGERTRIATEADMLKSRGRGLSVSVGDTIAPAGLYASDHDMFAFLVNESDPVDSGGGILNKGVFVQNSEVGDCALRLVCFTYDFVCGNHIVWGVGKVSKVSVRHVKGREESRGDTLSKAVRQWGMVVESLPSGDELADRISKARSFEIAATKEDVLDKLFAFGKAKSLPALTRGTLSAAYDAAERSPRYGAPTTVWGMVNGLTEVSQLESGADKRTDLDTQAGRILEMAF